VESIGDMFWYHWQMKTGYAWSFADFNNLGGSFFVFPYLFAENGHFWTKLPGFFTDLLSICGPGGHFWAKQVAISGPDYLS
jgi:hypothetical protein